MNKIKLPESFQNMDLDHLIDLVDLFVYQNQKWIPTKQLYNWDTKDLVPTLFLEFVKEHSFYFKENSAAVKLVHPTVGLLTSLIKKGEQIVKSGSNEVNHIGRVKLKDSEKNIINSNVKMSIYYCKKNDCININSGVCSCHPFKPIKEKEIIIDCLRYRPKEEFKFKSRDEALIVYSDLND